MRRVCCCRTTASREERAPVYIEPLSAHPRKYFPEFIACQRAVASQLEKRVDRQKAGIRTRDR